ncbi:MAG: TetR/AcrR family transcriptional regulator [Clostridia bacterium]|nr:TetR/AcrR family transcriptional regulator [Clostridia bacterium]
MDRRQKRTRTAIFNAFINLLSTKNYNNITVADVIELANVGRATFYSHFETKDYLLKELCNELFEHVFSVENCLVDAYIFTCKEKDTMFLHLIKHIKKNDNNIAKLLSCKNNELFLEYFKVEVKKLILANKNNFSNEKPKFIPEEFWLNHLTNTFIETIKWWIDNGMIESPETITEYFYKIVGIKKQVQ